MSLQSKYFFILEVYDQKITRGKLSRIKTVGKFFKINEDILRRYTIAKDVTNCAISNKTLRRYNF